MKRNSLTVIVGVLLVLLFVLLLFTYQVRETEVAVVTTFDRPTSFQEQPGLKWKFPPPIQKVYKFDKRIHNFEGTYQEALTSDAINVLAQTYVGWTISEPQKFFNSFRDGKTTEAEPALKGLIRDAQANVLGRHPFSDLISPETASLKFAQVEKEMFDLVSARAQTNYGIAVKFLGIKRLGLPEGVTEKVLARMTAERQREVERLKAEGDAEATKIKSAADRDRDLVLAAADASATRIRGEADAEAAKSFAVFSQEPRLAEFLFDVKALEQVLKEKSTLILDERIRPFNLLLKPSDTLLPANSQAK